MASSISGTSLDVTYSWVEELTINTGDGSDEIIVDNTDLAGNITVDGGIGADVLSLQGTDDAEIFYISDTELQTDRAAITLTDVETTDLFGGGGADVIQFVGFRRPLGRLMAAWSRYAGFQ